nr:Uma2 family endonuclease [Streptomyces sp. SID12501]
MREVAEWIEGATGLRVQIVGGQLVMSPPRCGKHVGVVSKLRWQLGMGLPDGLGAFAVSSIALPDGLGDPDDYVTPDLVVLPVGWSEEDCWLAGSEDAALVVEVVSPAERSRDIRGKVDWYSVARVPVLFVVDPRNGTWRLYVGPDNGGYRDVLPGRFGESVRLPEPLGVEVVTDGFPVYGASARALGGEECAGATG